ncbi:MAG: Rnase Y domain-containing protein, partial [Candidatus Binatia bacterium]
MDMLLYIILGVVIGACGVGVVVFLRQRWGQQTVANAEEAAKLIVEEAKKEGAVVKKEAQIQAKDIVLQAKTESEREVRERRKEIQQVEKRFQSREEALEKRAEVLEGRETELTHQQYGLKSREEGVQQKEQLYTRLVEETRKQLEQVAVMTRDEAKRILMEQMVDEAKHEAARRIMTVEEEAREEAERRAKKIISVAVERLAGEFITERTSLAIHLPSDDMKGRIIGREGRNIRAIEAAVGVDLIIDDTPESVLISSHSPIRREIARVTLERLIADGRIHPGRVEEVVK